MREVRRVRKARKLRGSEAAENLVEDAGVHVTRERATDSARVCVGVSVCV